METVRAAITSTNANRPKGFVEDGQRHWQVQANDQAGKASDYLPLVVSYKNGAAVRLSDVAEVKDSVLDVRNAGLLGKQPAVMIILFRQPGANIIETVERVKALLPQLQASIPPPSRCRW
jgi:multidrug efflux pump